MKRITAGLDFTMLGAIVPIVMGGLATMTSFQSEAAVFSRQLLWVGIGLLLMLIIAKIDMRFLRDSRYIMLAYGLSIVLLLWC